MNGTLTVDQWVICPDCKSTYRPYEFHECDPISSLQFVVTHPRFMCLERVSAGFSIKLGGRRMVDPPIYAVEEMLTDTVSVARAELLNRAESR